MILVKFAFEWGVVCLLVGLGLFYSGFLLTRHDLPNIASHQESFASCISTLTTVYGHSSAHRRNLDSKIASICAQTSYTAQNRPQPRVFLFIVDALRADFFLKSDKETSLSVQGAKKSWEWESGVPGVSGSEYGVDYSRVKPKNPLIENIPKVAFPLLHQYIAENPQSVSVVKQRADAPTTTTQRLKGFTTGTLSRSPI